MKGSEENIRMSNPSTERYSTLLRVCLSTNKLSVDWLMISGGNSLLMVCHK
jgi:hypothetical protein